MSVKTAEQDRNEQVIRRLYALAEGKSKETPAFVSQFAEGRYFYDVGAGKKYYGKGNFSTPIDTISSLAPQSYANSAVELSISRRISTHARQLLKASHVAQAGIDVVPPSPGTTTRWCSAE